MFNHIHETTLLTLLQDTMFKRNHLIAEIEDDVSSDDTRCVRNVLVSEVLDVISHSPQVPQGCVQQSDLQDVL